MAGLALDGERAAVSSGAETFENHSLPHGNLLDVEIVALHVSILIDRIGRRRLDKFSHRQSGAFGEEAETGRRFGNRLTAHQIRQKANLPRRLMIIIEVGFHV